MTRGNTALCIGVLTLSLLGCATKQDVQSENYDPFKRGELKQANCSALDASFSFGGQLISASDGNKIEPRLDNALLGRWVSRESQLGARLRINAGERLLRIEWILHDGESPIKPVELLVACDNESVNYDYQQPVRGDFTSGNAKTNTRLTLDDKRILHVQSHYESKGVDFLVVPHSRSVKYEYLFAPLGGKFNN
jgi:hypothetical protein